MDSVDKITRSRIMRSVRSKDTKLERSFYSALSSKGIGFIESNPSDIFGKPDFILRDLKVAIFLDSCFWHGCAKHLRMPRSNSEYWRQKIERNKKRDRLVSKSLSRDGWLVIRIWEHSLKGDTDVEGWAKKISNRLLRR